MIFKIDNNTKNMVENFGTNAIFPDGNVPNMPSTPTSQSYVMLHDNSDLARKIGIKSNWHCIFDESGILLDVEPLDIPIDKTAIKTSKIAHIKVQCAEKIYAGFDSTIKYGEPKHYTLKDYEQSNMQALIISIMGGAINVPWRHDQLIICDIWSASDFQQLYQQAMAFTVNQRYKSDVVEMYLLNEDLTVEQINSATLDMELPKYYQDILIEKLTLAGIPLWQ